MNRVLYFGQGAFHRRFGGEFGVRRGASRDVGGRFAVR
jgi:hypothetical protein